MRVYQESGKQNYRFFSDTPDLVAGSSAGIATQGATCPFDGCIGSSWNDRVAQISGKPVTTAAKLTVATPATTSTKKTTSKSTAISSAAQLAMSTVKPSGASGSASTVFAVAAAALSAVSAVFVALL